jgi:hypothetical protein
VPRVLNALWPSGPAYYCLPLGLQAFVDFEAAEQAAQAVGTRHGTMITTAAGIFQLSVQASAAARRLMSSCSERLHPACSLAGLIVLPGPLTLPPRSACPPACCRRPAGRNGTACWGRSRAATAL